MSMDWLAGMKAHTDIADRMVDEVPKSLSTPNLTSEEASRLFWAVEERAQAFDKFFAAMQNADEADGDLLKAGDLLEELFARLSFDCANKARSLRGLPRIQTP